jgi:hypothetical protein
MSTSADPGGSGQEPRKKRRRLIWWVLEALVLLIVIVTASGCGSSSGGSSSSSNGESSSTGGAKKAASKPKGCGSKATDDCTPHVGPHRSVRVDALVWRVRSARVAKTLGDQQFGLGAKADGRFIVVKLRVTSDRSESATLTDKVTQLEVDDRKYDPDNEGTVAAIGAGDQPFFLEDIGPDSTATGTVVFDVPMSVLSKKPEMRFNELGFGSTHGYIRLPSLSAASS